MNAERLPIRSIAKRAGSPGNGATLKIGAVIVSTPTAGGMSIVTVATPTTDCVGQPPPADPPLAGCS